MKKLSLSFALAVFIIGFANAQSAEQNSKRINFGVGFVNEIILVGGSFDYAVADNIFIGGNLYLHSKDQVSSIFPTIRGSYYFNNLLNLANDKLDLYAGLGASKVFVFYQGENASTDFFFPVHLGARYFFKEQLGAFAEFIPSNRVVDGNTFRIGIALKR